MTFHKTVRVGRLLEDLDIFAVTLCYKHILNPKQTPGITSPYSIVTALVDQIDISPTQLRSKVVRKSVGIKQVRLKRTTFFSQIKN